MKIIHTSDWHLGQDFYAYDRTEEHEAFFSQLAEIVAEEKPDALVVSGDIYHNAAPSNSVMRLFTDRLDAVRRACPSMQVVVTAGNHDSPSRLEVNRTLWEHLGVHVIGRIEKNEDKINFDHFIIPVYRGQKELCGYVVALPHIFAQSFPAVRPELSPEERRPAFMQALADRVNEVNTAHVPVVMMAHMAITGSDITGHDEFRGGMEYIPVTDLKVRFDYLALGHIHCPQEIKGAQARYCGSPIPVSFDENYGHFVVVVDLAEEGAPPACRLVPIHNPWPLLTFPKIAVPFEEAIQQLSDFPSDEKAYIRLHVKLQDVAPHNALELATKAVEGKQCRFCCFKWERTAVQAKVIRKYMDIDEMKAQSPVDVAAQYYEQRFNAELTGDLREMLDVVVKEIQDKME